MKYLLFASLVLNSGMVLASIQCDEPESVLNIDYQDSETIKVTHTAKNSPSRLPPTKSFIGKKTTGSPSGYYKVEEFQLKGKSGTADLKIITMPVLSRIPTCRARVCNDIGGEYTRHEITAELDYLGKMTHYDCQKI
jgi:hypothetical protein